MSTSRRCRACRQSADFATGGRAKLNLPPILCFGIRQEVTPQVALLGGVTWYGWSSFKEIRVKRGDGGDDLVNEQRYQDTVGVSIGGEYYWNDDLTLRAGFQYDPTPTKAGYRSSRTPDGDRYWLSAGASYDIMENMSVDFAYTHIFIDARKMDAERDFYVGTPLETQVSYDGSNDGSVDIVALGLRYRFSGDAPSDRARRRETGGGLFICGRPSRCRLPVAGGRYGHLPSAPASGLAEAIPSDEIAARLYSETSIDDRKVEAVFGVLLPRLPPTYMSQPCWVPLGFRPSRRFSANANSVCKSLVERGSVLKRWPPLMEWKAPWGASSTTIPLCLPLIKACFGLNRQVSSRQCTEEVSFHRLHQEKAGGAVTKALWFNGPVANTQVVSLCSKPFLTAEWRKSRNGQLRGRPRVASTTPPRQNRDRSMARSVLR